MFRGAEFVRGDFKRSVVEFAEFADAVRVDIETDHRVAFAERGGQRQTDVAQSDDGDADVVLGGK